MRGQVFLDQGVAKNCWNLIDSYGMICVKCNCCGGFDADSKDTSRLRVLRRWLQEWQQKRTDPGFQTELQQKNIRADIRRCQRQIRYYERKAVKA